MARSMAWTSPTSDGDTRIKTDLGSEAREETGVALFIIEGKLQRTPAQTGKAEA